MRFPKDLQDWCVRNRIYINYGFYGNDVVVYLSTPDDGEELFGFLVSPRCKTMRLLYKWWVENKTVLEILLYNNSGEWMPDRDSIKILITQPRKRNLEDKKKEPVDVSNEPFNKEPPLHNMPKEKPEKEEGRKTKENPISEKPSQEEKKSPEKQQKQFVLLNLCAKIERELKNVNR